MFAATRTRRGGFALLVALLCALMAAPARGAVPGDYAVKRIDGPAPAADRGFGAAVAAAGDLDGDGIPDFVAGNPAADNGSGEVLAYSGADGATVLWRAPAPFEPSNAGQPPRFGGRVARLGDVAGCGTSHTAGVDCLARGAADGVAEVLVSALGADAGGPGPDQGRVYVLDGRTGAVHRRLRLAEFDLPPTGNAEFGFSIASAGDLNNDGEPEAAVGAPGYDETFETMPGACEPSPGSGTCTDSGRVFVFPSAQLGGPAPSGSPSSDLPSDQALLSFTNPDPQDDAGQAGAVGERFGETIVAFGSNGLLIGAPLTDTGSAADAGVAYLVNASTQTPIEPPDPQTGGRFGAGTFSPPAFGNLGGGAAADVIVGAPGGQGRAYLFDGDVSAPGTARPLDPPLPVAGFASAMVRLPDDMPAIASPASGVVHVFNSNGTLAQTLCDPDLQAGAGFGAAIATLGDTNADGFDDLVVGAPGLDLPGAANGGRAYLLTSKGPAASGSALACVPSGGGSSGGGGGTGNGGGDGGGGSEVTPPDDDTVVIARVLRRIVLKANRNRVRRFKVFALRGRLTAVSNKRQCQSKQKVILQRSKRARGPFKTFDVVYTGAGGKFSSRYVGERSWVYRARVAQTQRCMAAVSRTAKVSISRRGR